MKTLILSSILFLSPLVHAAWTKVSCSPDLARMGGSRGGLISTPACGDQKICEVYAICSEVDTDTLNKYGTVDKIPPAVLAKTSFPQQGGNVCLSEAGHCPGFKVCMGNDPEDKHKVGTAWDELMPDLQPYIPDTVPVTSDALAPTSVKAASPEEPTPSETGAGK